MSVTNSEIESSDDELFTYLADKNWKKHKEDKRKQIVKQDADLFSEDKVSKNVKESNTLEIEDSITANTNSTTKYVMLTEEDFLKLCSIKSVKLPENILPGNTSRFKDQVSLNAIESKQIDNSLLEGGNLLASHLEEFKKTSEKNEAQMDKENTVDKQNTENIEPAAGKDSSNAEIIFVKLFDDLSENKTSDIVEEGNEIDYNHGQNFNKIATAVSPRKNRGWFVANADPVQHDSLEADFSHVHDEHVKNLFSVNQETIFSHTHEKHVENVFHTNHESGCSHVQKEHMNNLFQVNHEDTIDGDQIFYATKIPCNTDYVTGSLNALGNDRVTKHELNDFAIEKGLDRETERDMDDVSEYTTYEQVSPPYQTKPYNQTEPKTLVRFERINNKLTQIIQVQDNSSLIKENTQACKAKQSDSLLDRKDIQISDPERFSKDGNTIYLNASSSDKNEDVLNGDGRDAVQTKVLDLEIETTCTDVHESSSDDESALEDHLLNIHENKKSSQTRDLGDETNKHSDAGSQCNFDSEVEEDGVKINFSTQKSVKNLNKASKVNAHIATTKKLAVSNGTRSSIKDMILVKLKKANKVNEKANTNSQRSKKLGKKVDNENDDFANNNLIKCTKENSLESDDLNGTSAHQDKINDHTSLGSQTEPNAQVRNENMNSNVTKNVYVHDNSSLLNNDRQARKVEQNDSLLDSKTIHICHHGSSSKDSKTVCNKASKVRVNNTTTKESAVSNSTRRSLKDKTLRKQKRVTEVEKKVNTNSQRSKKKDKKSDVDSELEVTQSLIEYDVQSKDNTSLVNNNESNKSESKPCTRKRKITSKCEGKTDILKKVKKGQENENKASKNQTAKCKKKMSSSPQLQNDAVERNIVNVASLTKRSRNTHTRNRTSESKKSTNKQNLDKEIEISETEKDDNIVKKVSSSPSLTIPDKCIDKKKIVYTENTTIESQYLTKSKHKARCKKAKTTSPNKLKLRNGKIKKKIIRQKHRPYFDKCYDDTWKDSLSDEAFEIDPQQRSKPINVKRLLRSMLHNNDGKRRHRSKHRDKSSRSSAKDTKAGTKLMSESEEVLLSNSTCPAVFPAFEFSKNADRGLGAKLL